MVGLGLSLTVTYSAVLGFFAQDDPNANSTAIGALPPRFGLLDDSEGHWAKFKQNISQLNAEARDGEAYKVFFVGRHGEGFHNVAEAKYGTPAWNAFWSKLDGDGNITWGPDALLTPLGHSQALQAGQAWKAEIADDIPIPTRFFSSPLRRALDTWADTFLNDTLVAKAIFGRQRHKVTILENAREQYGVHTCDMRSNKTTLVELYPPPTYTFEKGFAEIDPLWTADVRESDEHVTQRGLSVIERGFEGHDVFISITAHSGFANGFLAAIGRPSYSLPTGGIIPVVVKRNVTIISAQN